MGLGGGGRWRLGLSCEGVGECLSVVMYFALLCVYGGRAVLRLQRSLSIVARECSVRESFECSSDALMSGFRSFSLNRCSEPTKELIYIFREATCFWRGPLQDPHHPHFLPFLNASSTLST